MARPSDLPPIASDVPKAFSARLSSRRASIPRASQDVAKARGHPRLCRVTSGEEFLDPSGHGEPAQEREDGFEEA